MSDAVHPLLQRYYELARERIGRRSWHDRGVVDARTIARYAVAIGSSDQIHFDPEHARAAGYEDVVAPPNFLASIFDWTEGQPEDRLNPDGTDADAERSGELSGLRGMGAGEEMEILQPLVAGTHVIEEVELVDVVMKHGSRGYSVFVTQQHTFSSGAGDVLNINRRTVVVRAPHEEER